MYFSHKTEEEKREFITAGIIEMAKKLEPEEEEKKEEEPEKVFDDEKEEVFDRKITDISYEHQKGLFEKTRFKIDTPTMFVKEFYDERGELVLEEFRTWVTTYEDVQFTGYVCDKEGNIVYNKEGKKIEKHEFIKKWLKDPNKRVYQKLIMNPNPDYKKNLKFYNMFKGFTWNKDNCIENCENIKPMLHHIKKRLCLGNKKHYKYCIKWLAHLIQKPHIKIGVALVMKSKPGAGKGTLVNLLKNIMSKVYFSQPTNSNDILGNHTSCRNSKKINH
jgi:hypothetical protein